MASVARLIVDGADDATDGGHVRVRACVEHKSGVGACCPLQRPIREREREDSEPNSLN